MNVVTLTEALSDFSDSDLLKFIQFGWVLKVDFEHEAVGREFCRPVQIFELSIIAVDGKRAFDPAHRLQRMLDANGPPKELVRPECSIAVLRFMGVLEHQQPACCHLSHPGEASPFHAG